MKNLIEGDPQIGQRVVVIEDLISTGGSSLKAVNALRQNGCIVLGMVAIFTYGFPETIKRFKEENCELYTLSNYDAMLNMAVETGYIADKSLETLKTWKLSPHTWGNEQE